ncbi:MAG: hypothetical protein F6K60_15285 [Okeania sp. SIO1F9]|nr:hypothetical protein [Okeania sp. SIO1F9]
MNGKVYITHTKPIGAYLKYLNFYRIPEGIEQERVFTKKKGYRLGAEYSLEISATLGANIKAIEASGTVTHSFTFTAEMEVEQEESFTEKITGPINLRVYQPVLLYVTVVEGNQEIKDHMRINNMQYVERGGCLYFTRGVFRNSPYLFAEEDWLEDVVDEMEFSEHLLKEAFDEWITDLEYQCRGRMREKKGYVFESNEHTSYIKAEMTSGGDEEKYIITRSGRFYNISQGRQVVSPASGHGGGITLLTYGQSVAEYDNEIFLYTEEKKIMEKGKGKYLGIGKMFGGGIFDKVLDIHPGSEYEGNFEFV